MSRGSVLAGSLLLVLVAGAGWLWWQQRGWTVPQLESLVQEEITPGGERAAVEAFLERHGIRHTFIFDTTSDRHEGQTMPSRAGLREQDLSGMVVGRLRGPDVNLGWGNNGLINVYFFFDKQGRLAGTLVFPLVFE